MIRILLLLGCVLSVAARAAEPLPFPEQLSEFQHRAFVDYEPQSAGLGYSHNYSGPNANASVYLYDRSAAVPGSVDDPFFAQELASARSDLEKFAAQEGYQQLQVARYGEFVNLRGYPMPVHARVLYRA